MKQFWRFIKIKYYYEKKPKLISKLTNYINGGGSFSEEELKEAMSRIKKALTEAEIH